MKRVGVDTDFLVCLAVADHPRHHFAMKLKERLEAELVQWVLVPQVISEFLHVVTDSRRFENPPTMSKAMTVVDYWLSVKNSELVAPSRETMDHFLRMMRDHNLGRKRILDTHFASTLLNAGVPWVVTGNGKDYRIFLELSVEEFE